MEKFSSFLCEGRQEKLEVEIKVWTWMDKMRGDKEVNGERHFFRWWISKCLSLESFEDELVSVRYEFTVILMIVAVYERI